MKKKLITLACLAAAVVVLLGVYAGAKKNNEQRPDEQTDTLAQQAEPKYSVVTYKPEEIKSVNISTSDDITFLVKDEGIVIENADMTLLKPELVSLMFNALINVRSDNLVGEFDDPAEKERYVPQGGAVVHYITADEEAELFIGNETPDKNYYYVNKQGSNEIYTVDKATCERIMQKVTDLADLTLDKLDPNALTMLEVTQKGREDLKVSFDKENKISAESHDKNGLATLVMHSPIENLLVYPYNIESGLLYDYDKFKLDKMVELGDEKYADYGLDDPTMTIAMADTENSVTLRVGKKTEDGGSYYVTPYGNKGVYTMSENALAPFFDYDIINFIQKFIALHYRYTLSDIEIKSVYGDYTVEFKEEDGKTLTEENGNYKDKRQEYINGKAVDSDAFTAYYELLVGLTFDALKEYEPTGEPQAEICYHLLDGSEDKVVFYDYDETFFAAVKGGGELKMLINKQQVKQAVDKAKELLG